MSPPIVFGRPVCTCGAELVDTRSELGAVWRCPRTLAQHDGALVAIVANRCPRCGRTVGGALCTTCHYTFPIERS